MDEEKWELINGWHISSPKHFFHLGNLQALAKLKDEHVIVLVFSGGGISVAFKEEKSRDGVFDFLKNAKIEYQKCCSADDDKRLAISQSHLGLQAKMTEKFLGMDTHV